MPMTAAMFLLLCPAPPVPLRGAHGGRDPGWSGLAHLQGRQRAHGPGRLPGSSHQPGLERQAQGLPVFLPGVHGGAGGAKGSSAKRVYGFDLASGAQRWQTQLPDRVWGSTAALYDGKAYIGAVDGCVRVLSLADGEERQASVPRDPTEIRTVRMCFPPCWWTGGAWFSARMTTPSSAMRWAAWSTGPSPRATSCTTTGRRRRTAWSSSPPTTRRSTPWTFWTGACTGPSRRPRASTRCRPWTPQAYIGDADGQMHALNLKDGAQAWSFRAGGAIVSSPALSGDGGLIFGSTDHLVYCLDAASGAKRWTFKTRDYVLASPLVTGSLVWIGSYDGVLYVLDLASGQERWSKELSGGIYTSAAAAGTRVLVAGRGGELDCSMRCPAASYLVPFGIAAPRWSRSCSRSTTRPAQDLSNLRWPGIERIFRPQRVHSEPRPLAGERRRTRLGSAQRALLPAHPIAGATLPVRYRSTLDRIVG